MKKILLCFFALLCLYSAQAQLRLDAPDGATYYLFYNDENRLTIIAKYNSDGTPDLSYGTAGVSEPINIFEIVGAAIQSDGTSTMRFVISFSDEPRPVPQAPDA